jgi:hypothetical protein
LCSSPFHHHQCNLFIGELYTDDSNVERHSIYSCCIALITPSGKMALAPEIVEASSGSNLWPIVGASVGVVAGLFLLKLAYTYFTDSNTTTSDQQ